MMQLQVHLKNEQYVIFNPSTHDGLSSATSEPPDTHLTAFFKANEKYPSARDLLYVDFPTKFTWHANKKEWQPRKQGNTCRRLVYIPPNAGEKFYACLVLSNTKDLRSFNDLQRANGVLYPSIREACLARGLLQDDQEWKLTLDEAVPVQTGTILRHTFLIILQDCFPSNPLELWEQYKPFLCDDLHRQLTWHRIQDITTEKVHDYGLYLIAYMLVQENNISMNHVGMPAPVHDWNSILHQLPQQHMTFNAEEQQHLLTTTLPLLNHEQHHAFKSISTSVLENHPCVFFLEGAAGSGKTFLYQTLCYAFRSQNLNVLCV